MKFFKFLLIGIFFGIAMTKSEAISWFRIQEMFLFDSFHMYGIIGTSVVLGIIGVAFIKKTGLKDFYGNQVEFKDKAKNYSASLFGGSVFGLGWAMTGACPGPMYTLIGHGFISVLLVIASAILGTFVYGMVKDRLPH
jgi:uncharacterized membrane protein YedE/YeeE